jgi:sulfonate transport system substrate-binding protein
LRICRSYKDITPVYLPPADARAAFQRGAIDAWVIWDPFLAEVETNAKARQIRNRPPAADRPG